MGIFSFKKSIQAVIIYNMCVVDKKELLEEISRCRLCPRECGINRNEGYIGYCGEAASVRVARASLHMWEEPCISGERGSGTVFFSGCSLKCVFCQNSVIANSNVGRDISIEQLSDLYLKLQLKGANNINLVTASHFIPQVAASIELARRQGLDIPIVYNTSSYEKVESLKLLDGLVDVYLPDMKYFSADLSRRYSNAADYFDVASAALAEMFSQVKENVFSKEGECIEAGIMKKGIIVRHLLLPGHLKDSKKILKYLHDTYGDAVFISIMNQYTPMQGIKLNFPELNRKVSSEEYDELVDYAIDIGIENGFIQEGETASESFIPAFDGSGLEEELENVEDRRKFKS